MPRLAISAGDPAGIGPEVTRLAASQILAKHPNVELAIFGDPLQFSSLADAGARVTISPVPCSVPAVPGQPTSANAPATIGAIEQGVRAVRSGHAQALITAPIAKSVLYEAGFEFPGHTEFLGHLAGNVRTHMMIAGPELRVVPVTLHQSLKSAIEDLSPDLIIDAARATHRFLQDHLELPSPRLAICGLNPHAGENGTMGQEDQTIIHPAIDALIADGIHATGPLPADTLFHPAARARYDCVLGMYHDQVLIPAKALAFDSAVNVTLGLPFIRTSPDHGTAFDIAGKGIADPSSMLAAMEMALSLSA